MSEVVQKSKLAKQAAQSWVILQQNKRMQPCSLWQMPSNGATGDY